MLLASVVVFGFLVFSHVGISWHLLLVPAVMLAEYLLALGLTLFFSAVTVYLRDMEYIVGVLLQAWIWATPIMYAIDAIPAFVGHILLLNPMTLVITSYHNLLYYHQLPTALTWIGMYTFGIIILLIGEVVFTHLEGNFAEEL